MRVLFKLKRGLFHIIDCLTRAEQSWRDQLFGWSAYLFARIRPNSLSKSRFVLSALLYFPISSGAALLVVSTAYFTDIVDGVLARSRGQVTLMGKVLDLTADLFLRLAVLTFLVRFGLLAGSLFGAVLGGELLFAVLVAKVAGQRGESLEHSFTGRLRGFFYAVGALWLLAGLSREVGEGLFWAGLTVGFLATLDYIFRQSNKGRPSHYQRFMSRFYGQALYQIAPFGLAFIAVPAGLSVLVRQVADQLPAGLAGFSYVVVMLAWLVCLTALNKLALAQVARAAKQALFEVCPSANFRLSFIDEYKPEAVLGEVEKELAKL